jgi:hypothetical protein
MEEAALRRGDQSIRFHSDPVFFYLEQIRSRSREGFIRTPPCNIILSPRDINTTPRKNVGVLPHYEGPKPG